MQSFLSQFTVRAMMRDTMGLALAKSCKVRGKQNLFSSFSHSSQLWRVKLT